MINRHRIRSLAPALLLALPLSGCAMTSPFGQAAPPAATVPVAMTYADAADLALAAPVIVDLSVDRVIAVAPERAQDVPAGLTRYYVEANVLTLLRGQGGVPARLNFLVDAPAPPGRARRYLAFARPVQGNPASIQLVRANSLVAWSPENEALTRAATQEAVAINAPPTIARMGQAFHFPGQVEGEGETQVFLETTSGEPVSLRIVSVPGQPRRWGISLGEVVAADPTPPPPNSLLWYRLACENLPQRIESGDIAAKSSGYAAQIRSDYQFVRDSLGPCPRNLR